MILVALLASVSGCDDTLYGEATTEPDGLVYTPDWDGVTAMIGDHCAACHAPGGSADFAPLPDVLIADLQGITK